MQKCAMFLQHIFLAFIFANVVQTSYGPFHMTRTPGCPGRQENGADSLSPQEGRRSAFGVRSRCMISGGKSFVA